MTIENQDNGVSLGSAEEIDLDALLPLWMEVFAQPADVFDGVWSACPRERRHTFVARAPEGIVSSVQLYVLPFRAEAGETENVGCIANVATRPAYRKQGLSSKLLRLAIARMEEVGCGWSYLFTGVPEHYARHGWESQERAAYIVEPAPKPEGASVRRLTEADLPAVRGLYERHYSSTPLSLERNDQDWKVKLPRRFSWRVAYGIGDPLSAYAVVDREGKDLVIGEWAASTREDYVALLAAARQEAGGRLILSAPVSREMQSLLSNSTEIVQSAGMTRPISSRWSSDRLAALLRAPNAKLSFLDNF